ncbi:molybdopterin-guanine dinucleotide biosynthesis protein MobB, partial [Salmonella enterica]|uniref:molybdopterin-guanine dinucleotide biosynthesis protein MobB n=1 Tax=Salmonella enterica TaxID=28901 RepID=UPI00398C6226
RVEVRKRGAERRRDASQQGWALMTEKQGQEELDRAWVVRRMEASKVDMVLVEGFRHEAVAKILLFRQGCGHSDEELILDEHVIAVASDIPLAVAVPVLDLNDVSQIAAFILRWLEKAGSV